MKSRRKIRKKIRDSRRAFFCLSAVMCLAAAILLSSCAGGNAGGEETVLYGVNFDGTGLKKTAITLTADNAQEQVNELAEAFNSREAGNQMEGALPDKVQIERSPLVGEQLYLYFNEAYLSMSPERELLCRAALVKTFMQDIQDPGISGVEFFVSDLPLTDQISGEKIGIMRADSFSNEAENDGDDTGEWDLTLYFSNRDGNGLVSENRTVRAPGNVSGAAVVMRELMKGPEEQGHVGTLDQDVVLNRVSVMDGVCYVDLSGEFRKQDYAVQADVIVYSIVNSLTELSQVNHVHLSIDGDSDTMFRNEIPLYNDFIKNQELVD